MHKSIEKLTSLVKDSKNNNQNQSLFFDMQNIKKNLASQRNNSKTKDNIQDLNLNAYSTYNFPNTLNQRHSLESMVTQKTD